MKKQMQETVEEANEGVTADMLFSACIEAVSYTHLTLPTT